MPSPTVSLTIWRDPNAPYDNTRCYNSSRSGCVTQWAWANLQAYQAWDLATGSSTVGITVGDTGISCTGAARCVRIGEGRPPQAAGEG